MTLQGVLQKRVLQGRISGLFPLPGKAPFPVQSGPDSGFTLYSRINDLHHDSIPGDPEQLGRGRSLAITPVTKLQTVHFRPMATRTRLMPC